MDERTRRAIPVLLAVGCTWGGSFLFIKVIVEDTGPLELVAGRLLLGMLAIVGYMLLSGKRPVITRRLVAQVSVLAILSNVLPFGLIACGEEHVSSGSASILNATVPIFTATFAAAILDEEYFTSSRVGGLLLGFLGVGVLTGRDVLDITDSDVLGEVAVVGAAACYGLGAVYARNLLREQDALNLSFLQLSLGFLYSVPILLAVTGGAPDYRLDTEAYLSLAALGLFGSGAAYIGYMWLISHIGSVRASLVTYIVPVIAVVLGWAVLDETVGVNTVLGGLLIVAGVATVMRGATPVRREPEAPMDAIPAAVGE